MTHRHRSLAYSLVLVLSPSACDQGQTPIGGFEECADPSAGDTVADGGDPPAQDIEVDCVFSFLGASQVVTFEANAEYEPRVVGGDLNVTATLFDDEFEGRSFQIVLFTVDGSVSASAIYQFAPGTLPLDEFWGDHGFTGLHGLRDPQSGESVQWICAAREPDDPVHTWD